MGESSRPEPKMTCLRTGTVIQPIRKLTAVGKPSDIDTIKNIAEGRLPLPAKTN